MTDRERVQRLAGESRELPGGIPLQETPRCGARNKGKMGGGKRRPIRDSDDEAEQQLVPRPPKKRAIKDEKAREAEAEEDDDDDGGDGEANEDEDEEFEVDCIIKKRWVSSLRPAAHAAAH